MNDEAGYLAEQVRQALIGDRRVGELDIGIRLAGGKAFVTGTVATEHRRCMVAAVMQELLPGWVVCNETGVSGVEGEPKVERLG